MLAKKEKKRKKAGGGGGGGEGGGEKTVRARIFQIKSTKELTGSSLAVFLVVESENCYNSFCLFFIKSCRKNADHQR